MIKAKSSIKGLPSGISVLRTKNGNGVEFWRVRVGRRFTGGEVIKKDFAKLQDGRAWIENLKTKQSDVQSTKLSPGQLAEATQAFGMLAETKATLVDAVSYFIKHSQPTGGVKTWAEVTAELLKKKQALKKAPRTLKAYRLVWDKFSIKFGKLPIATIDKKSVEKWILNLELAPLTLRNYRRDLGTVFAYAAKENYLPRNFVPDIELPESEESAVTIYSPLEVNNLLRTNDIELLTFFVFGFFAGLRTSEILRLDWASVREDGIELKSGQTKTRSRRFVSASAPFKNWLPLIRRKGKVLTVCECGISDRRAAWTEKLGLAEWRPNAARHSFGTYLFAHTRNENHVAAEMGNSPAMVHKHYKEVVTLANANAYWALAPSDKKAALHY